MKIIELLSPAKTADIGIEAILHGADAVYIGASDFGARKAAGNSLEDISRLVNFAHIYNAKVYVTVNTIVKENEIADVQKLISDLYNIGVDALIVQDFGILKMDIPPIALHASTQMHNTTPEKVKFLEDIGFSQIVLARECTKTDIENISKNTNVKLETFVHGALCVSYSGRCYASEALCGRSANRGECAQICRLPFQLQDAHGHNLGTKHWLSLKDMDHSDDIEEMISIGVTSFKIEGRLKDADYVKNVTAYYNNLINKAILKHSDWRRESDGKSVITFTPNKYKTFFRGGTNYFYNGRNNSIYSPYTPKSIGEYIGNVTTIKGKTIEIITETELHNGDGLCFFDQNNQFYGFRINTATNKVSKNGKLISCVCETFEPVNVTIGCDIYRNYDIKFSALLDKPTATRKIDISLKFEYSTLIVSDGNIEIRQTFDIEKQIAQKNQNDNIKAQLLKLGDTPYSAVSVIVDTPLFFPMNVIAVARRAALSNLTKRRVASALENRKLFKLSGKDKKFPIDRADYTENIANHLAREFYNEHGVSNVAEAFEVSKPLDAVPIMYCRHCIRFMMGACKKNSGTQNIDEPLYLIHKNYYLRLEFDCKNCIMKVYQG